ncbi:hypothetical protein G6F29_013042 [Rhizopus arrhizus]|nr:hypothetical protein G6F29_013042 [Rhizopus arrhizus]
MAHKDWTVDDWKRVIWSDETKINRFNSDRRTWAWIRSGESLKYHHVKMTVKRGGGNIMLWSAITYTGVGWMCKINVKEYLEQQSHNILEWPAQSPDLNPIENMWSLLKRRLNDYETAPKGMNELYERVTKVWYDLMKPEECQKVIETMPKRIKQCIKDKERWTDY